MSVGPRNRVTPSTGPTTLHGALTVDRYLRALEGVLPLGSQVFDALEREFIYVAKKFAGMRGISYGAWRDVGVPEAVLKRADIQQLEVVAG
jgi:hypothetical protein